MPGRLSPRDSASFPTGEEAKADSPTPAAQALGKISVFKNAKPLNLETVGHESSTDKGEF